MTRIVLMTLAPLALAGCLAAPPEVGEPVAALRPAAAPYPADVLRALPPGVGLDALKVDAANCYFYDSGAGPQPVMTATPAGQQPFCGV